jgi:cytochrome c oxidase cbb3-type subunit 4
MSMDIEWMRSSMTVIAFATFIGIVMWAWSSGKRSDFDVAARSVLEDDAPENANEAKPGARHSMNKRGSGHE